MHPVVDDLRSVPRLVGRQSGHERLLARVSLHCDFYFVSSHPESPMILPGDLVRYADEYGPRGQGFIWSTVTRREPTDYWRIPSEARLAGRVMKESLGICVTRLPRDHPGFNGVDSDVLFHPCRRDRLAMDEPSDQGIVR